MTKKLFEVVEYEDCVHVTTPCGWIVVIGAAHVGVWEDFEGAFPNAEIELVHLEKYSEVSS